ncbi:MAG TPA: sigma-54 dependent transcriptional regulator [Phycisphaerae bacterium]|nr:sigma-54 dependent transcriptional regulator [Phycisphaerae bacterium]
MGKAASIRVLVVDDEIDHADVMAEAIVRMGAGGSGAGGSGGAGGGGGGGVGITYSVKQAHNLADAKRFFAEDDAGGFDLVITDLRMDTPNDGLELLDFIRRARPQSEVIVVTAHGDVSTAVAAMRRGAYDFIQKPLELDVIRTQVRRAAEKILLARKNQELSNALDKRFGVTGIIGQSVGMVRVLQLIQQIAPTDISVLVLGESGTGKELVARAIHQNSRRHAERFVALNCAGLNESTLEDELFGHVRGAFTDARGDRQGRFEYADGGTLFLDEIGDMPLAMQAKLLRVLQDREITRLGSNDPIKVDVRFISATNKDLQQAVRDKTFREDLYFRIRGAVIELPPLRARRDDIPLLINHVIDRSPEKLGRKIEGIDAAARNALAAYAWPGNVRELENTVENMIVLAQSPRLTMADLPAYILQGSQTPDPGHAIIRAQPAPAAITLAGKNLADLEKQAIEETLSSVQGNREQAAKILGIGERTLYRKIKEYGLKE